MRWDVYVVDFIERTCEIVLTSVPMEDAKDFRSVWKDADSQVVILPDGFNIIELELETAQSELNSLNTGN